MKLNLSILLVIVCVSAIAQNEFPTNGPVIIDNKIGFKSGLSDGRYRGIWFWEANDPNHAIYSASPSTGISPKGNGAPAGLWDAEHRLRFRTATTQGFLFENMNEVALVDIDADNGNFKSIGVAHFEGLGSNYFSGNVGIGTNAPAEKLEVRNGSIIVGNTSGGDGELYLGNSNHGLIRDANILKLYTAGSNGGISLIHRQWDGTGYDNWVTNLHINSAGNVGIGTETPTHKLEVNGTIRSQEVKVEASPWPDYVFQDNYNLATLEEIESFIKSEGHLPEIPSAAEIEANGLKLGEMNRLLLKKIEELTLYTINQKDHIDELKNENGALKEMLEVVIKRIEKLEKE